MARFVALLATAFLLGGCGMRGPLYLPPPPQPDKRPAEAPLSTPLAPAAAVLARSSALS